jgi:hypothetical protein
MRGAFVGLLLCLAACATAGAMTRTSGDAVLVPGWRTAVGQTPTRAEFTAVYAACEDRLRDDGGSAPFAGCLADLGLRRVQ